MNVSLPFASPARKQDTTNNNKQGQPHDSASQIYSEDFAKFCGILRIYELYISTFNGTNNKNLVKILYHVKNRKSTSLIFKFHYEKV